MFRLINRWKAWKVIDDGLRGAAPGVELDRAQGLDRVLSATARELGAGSGRLRPRVMSAIAARRHRTDRLAASESIGSWRSWSLAGACVLGVLGVLVVASLLTMRGGTWGGGPAGTLPSARLATPLRVPIIDRPGVRAAMKIEGPLHAESRLLAADVKRAVVFVSGRIPVPRAGNAGGTRTGG